MTNEPIINAKLKKFIQQYELEKLDVDSAFERFANYSILFQHQPDAFSSDQELLDTISVGGGKDNGIDGIAIKVNGFLIKTVDEIDELAKSESLNVEFIFIQSKNKNTFKNNELLTFLSGVRAFFEPGEYQVNDSVVFWRNLKEYIYSDDVMCQCKNLPSIRCYYLTNGKWIGDKLHEDNVIRSRKDMIDAGHCSDFYFHFWGNEQFHEALNRNENKFKVIMPFIDTMNLPSADNVENSCVALCRASEFIQLLNTEEGIIRKSLFNDNVRDYQGENSVNIEIEETIEESPNEFILLNNGITIVCTKFLPNNRKLVIDNPQIVNGCQTSNVLYNAYKRDISLDNISVVVKVIATTDMEIANKIVRGTNRQSIVLEEAFEGTKKFHKNLESFVNSYQADFQDKIYYERRAKQYNNNPAIKPLQKINLKVLIQTFVGAVLHQPHDSHQHESVLLKKYKHRVFLEEHSLLPYFASMYAFYTLTKLLSKGCIDKYYNKYKAHVLMIYFKLVAGDCPKLSSEKAVDVYADKILKSLYNIEKAKEIFSQAVNIFNDCKQKWIVSLHRNKYAMKDVPEFTDLILKTIDKAPLDSLIEKLNKQQEKKYGNVSRIFFQGQNPYGFIACDGETIFFSLRKNRNLSFKGLKGKRVSFIKSLKDGKGRVQALNVRVEV